jgi:para-aminobenzoate synthetase component 1
MEQTSFAQWREWFGKYEYLPFVASFSPGHADDLDARCNPLSWEPLWQSAGASCAFVLESGKRGRYSYCSFAPKDVAFGKGGKPLPALKQWMGEVRAPRLAEAPDFLGGCVGYLAYDVARSIEKLPEQTQDDLDIPDYYFSRYEKMWIVDHQQRQLLCVSYSDVRGLCETSLGERYRQAEQQSQQMKAQWDTWVEQASRMGSGRRQAFSQWTGSQRSMQDGPDELVQHDGDIRTSFSKQQFIEAVQAIQDYIAAGDVFQVNLSVRQSRPLQTQPTDVYEWLRLVNPSPYMGYLKFPEFALVCGSPELLIKLQDRRLSTRPIAGTRPRGDDAELDSELAAELILNEKERAEHIMLVDLERNDIGKVAQLGSVHVSDLMTIEKYSHVMHIVSQVEGKLRNDLDAFAAIAATFPGGTITGAPKIRTMEIIEELEPVRRGPYTGSLGWLDYNGDMELNIIIRTMLAHKDWAHVQAGAGIVIDSVPEKEFVESLNKARAMWTAVHLSEQMKNEDGSGISDDFSD